MSQSPAPYPMNSAEKIASVRRIGFPMSISAAILGLASLAMLILRYTTAYQPPALIAVYLSYFAMMMGIGILFYVRHTPRMRLAIAASLIALFSGLAGTAVYAVIAIRYRSAEQSQEFTNLTAIAAAAKSYAQSHNGNYPADLATLIEEKFVPIAALHSPYERMTIPETDLPTEHDALQKYLDDHTDYQYLGQNLKLPATPAARPEEDPFAKIILASRRDPIERRDLSIVFTDGRPDMIDLEEAEDTLKKSNQARQSLGFPAVLPPASIERAQAQQKADQNAGR